MPAQTNRLIELELSKIKGDDKFPTRVVTFKPGSLVEIGRSSQDKSKDLVAASDNLWLSCAVVSREHAQIHSEMADEGLKLTLQDVGSSHGTFLNDYQLQRGEKREIQYGDSVTFGTMIVRAEERFSPPQFKVRWSMVEKPEEPAPADTKSTYSCPDDVIVLDDDNEAEPAEGAPSASDSESDGSYLPDPGSEADDNESSEDGSEESSPETDGYSPIINHELCPWSQATAASALPPPTTSNLLYEVPTGYQQSPWPYTPASDPQKPPMNNAPWFVPETRCHTVTTAEDRRPFEDRLKNGTMRRDAYNPTFVTGPSIHGQAPSSSTICASPEPSRVKVNMSIASLIDTSIPETSSPQHCGTKRKRDEFDDEDEGFQALCGDILLTQTLPIQEPVPSSPPEVGTEEPVETTSPPTAAKPQSAAEEESALNESASKEAIQKESSQERITPPSRKRARLGTAAFGLACFVAGGLSTIATLVKLPDGFFQ